MFTLRFCSPGRQHVMEAARYETKKLFSTDRAHPSEQIGAIVTCYPEFEISPNDAERATQIIMGKSDEHSPVGDFAETLWVENRYGKTIDRVGPFASIAVGS